MEKLLLTPGPLSTTMEVKEKMLYDYGSRDSEFLNIININEWYVSKLYWFDVFNKSIKYDKNE